MNELISVLVPVYNVEKYLGRCIESIQAQDYTQIEVILVDDGSTDASPRICDETAEKDPRFRVIHQENQGLPGARNTGLRNSSGKYVCFVDSDDYLEPRYLSTLYAGITKGYDLAVVGYNRFSDKDDGPLATYDFDGSVKVFSGDACIGHMFRCDYDSFTFGVVWNKLYRRELLEGIDFYDLYTRQDEPFNLRVYLRSANVLFIQERLYNYILRDGSILSGADTDIDQNKRPFARCRGIEMMEADIPSSHTMARHYILQRIFSPYFIADREILVGTEFWPEERTLCKRLYRRTVRAYLKDSEIPSKEKFWCLLFWKCPFTMRRYQQIKNDK